MNAFDVRLHQIRRRMIRMAELMTAGKPADDAEVPAEVERQYRWISLFWTRSRGIRRLGRMYAQDERSAKQRADRRGASRLPTPCTGTAELISGHCHRSRRCPQPAPGCHLSSSRPVPGWLRRSGMRVAMVETGGDPGHTPARRVYEKTGYTVLPVSWYFQALWPAPRARSVPAVQGRPGTLACRARAVACVLRGAPAWPGTGLARRRRLLRPQGDPAFMTRQAGWASAAACLLRAGCFPVRSCLLGSSQGGPLRGEGEPEPAAE